MSTVRTLFPNTRPIDRPIEKVIDYYVDRRQRGCARKSRSTRSPTMSRATSAGFSSASGTASARAGHRDRHLGLGLLWLRQELVHEVPRLCSRPGSHRWGTARSSTCLRPARSSRMCRAELLARKSQPTAVIMLDLGSEQLRGLGDLAR